MVGPRGTGEVSDTAITEPQTFECMPLDQNPTAKSISGPRGLIN
jgi:hypothetical protein